MGKRIVLYRENQGWMAMFSEDEEIKGLFGTNTIPTAFTKLARRSDVVREIQRLNPDCVVEAYGQEVLP